MFAKRPPSAPSITYARWRARKAERRTTVVDRKPLVLVARAVLTTPAVFKPSGVLPAGFVAPCLPTQAAEPPSGGLWLHEIKHDGFRVIARKDGNGVRL
jgi:ATP-dependent DNA ligase